MAKSGGEQQRELIQASLSQHPDASFSEIGNFLGISKQRHTDCSEWHKVLMLRGALAS